MIVACPYCKTPCKLVDGTTIYPHRPDLADKNFYFCKQCDAYCGCHKGTTKPLGLPADAALRRMRLKAHSVFDPIWKSGSMRRNDAYSWLSSELGIPKQKCHIGMFDSIQCNHVIIACKKRNRDDNT